MKEASPELWEIRINHRSARYPRLNYLNAARVPRVEASSQPQTFRKTVIVAGCNLSSRGPAPIFLRRPIESSIIHMLQRKLFIQSSLDCGKGSFLSPQHSPNHLPAPPETHVRTVPADTAHASAASRRLAKRDAGQLSHSQERTSGSRPGLRSTPWANTSNDRFVAKARAPATELGVLRNMCGRDELQCSNNCNYNRCFKTRSAEPV